MKKGGFPKWIVFLIVIVALVAVYFTFFFYYKCDSLACFQEHQKNCDSTKFIRDTSESTWNYKILNKKNGECRIEVTLLQVKKGNIDLEKLQGQSMICSLTLGSYATPEGDISKCHGDMKEGLQQIIIQKMHSYILNNLGQIGSELDVNSLSNVTASSN